MRRGKFNDALDQYDAAERSAPNNPFTRLGRSFAELGASYYSRSDADLRRVIVAEPALLAGRYDLNGFLGTDRLQFITKDLQDISAGEKSNVSASFLLAFISHSAGNDHQAAGYPRHGPAARERPAGRRVEPDAPRLAPPPGEVTGSGQCAVRRSWGVRCRTRCSGRA